MKIVLAPNALKGCLTATQAAEAMARGVARACPAARVVRVPVADGGDGLADVLVNALGGETLMATVTGPRGDPVSASFCHVPTRRLAVIEMAAASGLALLAKDRLNPLLTTIQGTGELIAAALNLGVSHLIVGVGGSATNADGIGMAAALGARFLDADGEPVELVGGALAVIRRIDLSGSGLSTRRRSRGSDLRREQSAAGRTRRGSRLRSAEGRDPRAGTGTGRWTG